MLENKQKLSFTSETNIIQLLINKIFQLHEKDHRKMINNDILYIETIKIVLLNQPLPEIFQGPILIKDIRK